MSGIIGNIELVNSSLPPLEAHILHLRHLSNTKIAKDLLRERHRLTEAQAKETSKIFSSQIAQALEFLTESMKSPPRIRPVLQYYAYLNLSVAAILAFRPPNHDQYRRHGVEDKTHMLNKLDLSSVVLKINKGAVPLFHSIISDAPLNNKRFRFGQVAAGFHMFSHELKKEFDKVPQRICVEEELIKLNNKWYSSFSFFKDLDESSKNVPRKRIEKAMPLLTTDYSCNQRNRERIIYRSIGASVSQENALKIHKKNGIKFINYGAHITYPTENGGKTHYYWAGLTYTPLMPTLSSILLMSFSLASIVRYRPILLETAMNSPISLLMDTFVSEADSIFIPALRNMLYQEEVSVGSSEYI